MRILLPLQYQGPDGQFSGIVVDDIDRELEDLSEVMGVRLRYVEGSTPVGINDPNNVAALVTMIWVEMTPLTEGADVPADPGYGAVVHDGERDVEL